MPALKDQRKEKFAQLLAKGVAMREARKQAGYTPNKGTAWKASRRSDIASRVLELTTQHAQRERAALARAAERYAVTTDRVVAELARIAFANSLDYWRVDSNGNPVIDLAKITRDQGAAISEIIVDEYKDGRSEDAREVKRIRIKLADKRAALVDLGRHLGLFVDPSVVNLNVANFFTEKPPSMAEWRKEIELQAKPASKTGDSTGKIRDAKEKRLHSVS